MTRPPETTAEVARPAVRVTGGGEPLRLLGVAMGQRVPLTLPTRRVGDRASAADVQLRDTAAAQGQAG